MNHKKSAFLSLLILLFVTLAVPGTLSGYELDFSYIGAELVKKEGEREIYKKKSGLTIYKYKNREEAHLSDGTRIIRFGNGKREVYPPDGVKIYINYDGSIKYIYPDGKEKFISMDGVTPFGIRIIGENRTIRRNKIRVDVIYSSEMSDDIMSKYIKNFYDEIANHAQKLVYQKKIRGRNIRIVLSFCRFGKTGYCRRNNRKGLDVIGYRDGKKEKIIPVNDSELYNKDVYRKTARMVVEKILIE